MVTIKSFINKYNWEVIYFSSEKDYWKNFSVIIALNVLYHKKKKYILLLFQNNFKWEKQVIILMILNGD